MSSSIVTFNAISHAASFVSSQSVKISLSQADLAVGGSFPVVVTNPSPGGGASNSVDLAVNDPMPTFSSVSPSIVAVGAPDTVISVTGTNFVAASVVNLNAVTLTTIFVSASQLTATIPAGSISSAGIDQLTVSNPSPGGGTSGPGTLTVIAVGSVVVMAAPQNGAQTTGPWQMSAAVVDGSGNPISGILVNLRATQGTVSPNQGVTDATGTLLASVSPPVSYSGEPVAVTATTGAQTAAIDIVFINPTAAATRAGWAAHLSRASRKESNATPSASMTLTSPFLFGTSANTGTTNPFANPNLCYSNADLSSTVSASCQTVDGQNGVQPTVLNVANTVCNGISLTVGVASCAGTVASLVACAAAETGIGAVICAGTIEYIDVLGSTCIGFLADELANYVTHDPRAATSIDVISFQPGSTNPNDYIGLICDAVADANIGSGSGSSGVSVAITPLKPVISPGGTIQFIASVTGTSDTGITWAVNGVPNGVGVFGTVSNTGLYTAPSAVPNPNPVTVSATSTADPSAVAPALVTVISASGEASGSTAIIAGLVDGQLVDKAYVPLPNSEAISVVNVDSQSDANAVVVTIPMPGGYEPNATGADSTTQQIVVISDFSPDVQIIDASQDKLIATLTSPVTQSATFSGGTCMICGVLVDPTTNTAILDTAQGYTFLNLTTHQFSSFVSGSVAGENFGYNPNSQIIMNPTYDQNIGVSLQAIDSVTSALFTYAQILDTAPDSAAFDLNTNLAVVPDEFSGNQLLINMAQASFSNSAGTFAAPTTVFNTNFTSCGDPGDPNEWTMVSIESVTHFLFVATEFGDCAAVEPLPNAVSAGAPPVPSVFNWGHMPSAPDGFGWDNGADPHGVAVFTSVVDGKPYGFLIRSDQAWVARVDLKGLAGAPPFSGGGPGQIDLTPFVVFLSTQ